MISSSFYPLTYSVLRQIEYLAMPKKASKNIQDEDSVRSYHIWTKTVIKIMLYREIQTQPSMLTPVSQIWIGQGLGQG